MPSIDKEKFVEMMKQSMPKNLGEREIKLWMNKIADENLLKKPFEAYTLKERLLIRNNITRETMKDLVEVYGVKNLDNVADTGLWKAVKLTGDKNPIGFLKEAEYEMAKGVLHPEMKTVDMLARSFGYDGFTNAFKKLVTVYFPSFHVRNALSGVVQNYEVLGSQALNPANLFDGVKVMRGGDETVNIVNKLTKKKYTYKELNKILTDKFHSASRYISDFQTYADDILKIKPTKKLDPRRLGNWIETNQKANAMITALKKGYDMEDALRLAEKAGFDYSVMTKFESSIMKRLVPFYAFARKNATLQASTLVAHPHRIINQKKALDMFSEIIGGGKVSEEDIKGVPSWVREAIGFKVDDETIVSGFDLPVQEFLERVSDPFKTTMTSLNPLLKYPIEAKTGYDFFRGKQIENITSIKEPMFKLINSKHCPQAIKDVFEVYEYEYEVKVGKEKGKTKKGFKANPEALHLLRNIPTERLRTTLVKVFDGNTITANKILSLIIGARLYDIDTGLQEHYERKDLLSEWQSEMMLKGKGYEQSTFHLNK